MQRQIGLKLEVDLLERLNAECRRRGCTRKDAITAGVLLWLQDPPESRKAWTKKSKLESAALVAGVRPAVQIAHAQTCRCTVCRTS